MSQPKHPMPITPVMTRIVMRPNLNFQYRSAALSLSFKEIDSSVAVAGGAAAGGVFGPGVGAPAAMAEPWVRVG